VGPSMESPSFISIPSSFDPNSTTATTPTLTSNPGYPSRMRRPSRGQSRSSSSSPAFKPMISPSLQPLLPGGSLTLNNLLTFRNQYRCNQYVGVKVELPEYSRGNT
jgi:hypothetical protein